MLQVSGWWAVNLREAGLRTEAERALETYERLTRELPRPHHRWRPPLYRATFALLGEWGYGVEYHEYEPGRTSVIARGGGSAAKAPLCLTGHIDTVALGSRAWTKDPFSGETDGDRLYGRGSSDMKAGVAAILLAAREVSKKLAATPGTTGSSFMNSPRPGHARPKSVAATWASGHSAT